LVAATTVTATVTATATTATTATTVAVVDKFSVASLVPDAFFPRRRLIQWV
jgi:hypothetical protein